MDDMYSKKSIPTFPGELTVIRSMFIVNGKLFSPVRHHLWGEKNSASCRSYLRCGNAGVVYDRVPHDIASKSCSCGFYAYFDEEPAFDYHHNPLSVIAICGAYGRVTYGSQGLRASKMRLKAIVVSSAGSKSLPKEPVRPPVTPRWHHLIAGYTILGGLVPTIFDPPLAVSIAIVLSVFLTFSLMVFHTFRDVRRTRKYVRDVNEYIAALNAHPDSLHLKEFRVPAREVEMVEKRYPGVPIYYSIEEALKDFPLSGPPEGPGKEW